METNKGDPRDEYKDLSDNMRHYGNMRFAQLTLFGALTAGLLTVVFTTDPRPSDLVRRLLKACGVVTAVVFWVMEERAGDYWHHYRRRAVKLEEQLGYQQYTTRPTRWLANATNAVRMLYAFIFLFWVMTLCCLDC